MLSVVRVLGVSAVSFPLESFVLEYWGAGGFTYYGTTISAIDIL